MRRLLLITVIVLASSCGGASSSLAGSSHGALPDQPIELALRTVDGHVVDLVVTEI